MIYSAVFNDNKLILTPPDLSVWKIKTPSPVEIDLKNADSQLGAFTGTSLQDGFYLIRKDASDFLNNLDLNDAKRQLPNFVEIESIDCTVPFEIAFGEKSESGKFIHDALSKVATGQPTEDGYKTRALINPRAIRSVEDKGDYRIINLKAVFTRAGGAINTVLSETQIRAIAKPGSDPAP